MGAVCCKAQTGSASSITNTDSYSFLESQHQWRVHGGFSPPLSSRWDPSTLTPLQYHHHQLQPSSPQPASSVSSLSREHEHTQTTLSSSSHSRNASRDDGDQLAEPSHQTRRRGQSENYSVTTNSSPQESFSAPDWISRDLAVGDFSSDSQSRTSENLLSREGYPQSSIWTTADTSQHRRNTSQMSGNIRRRLRQNLSGNFSSFPKLGTLGFFRRQNSDSRALQKASSSSNYADQDERSLSQRLGAQGVHPDFQAFSQLFVSSHRDHSTESLEGFPLSLERIRLSTSSNSVSQSGAVKRNHQTCILCSRSLVHRSPWSSHRMIIGRVDLPVVGVLVCGHVFHADCLDKTVPESLKHDPPCPECDKQKQTNAKSYLKSTVKAASGPWKSKLAKIGPQLWKKPFLGLKSNSVADLHQEKSNIHVQKEQPFLNMKVNKDPPSQSISSKKYGSPAQVSPENQL